MFVPLCGLREDHFFSTASWYLYLPDGEPYLRPNPALIVPITFGMSFSFEDGIWFLPHTVKNSKVFHKISLPYFGFLAGSL